MESEEKSPKQLIKSGVNALLAYKCCVDSKDEENMHTYSEIIENVLLQLENIIVKKQKSSDGYTPENLISAVANSEFIMVTLSEFPQLSVEHRKQFARVFCGCLSYYLDREKEDSPILAYILKNEVILDILLHFYDHAELAIVAGDMLRSCATYDQLAQLLLQDKRLDLLFSYFTKTNFDISSDSFLTYKALLLTPPSASIYLERHFSATFHRLHSLLDQNNYTTCISTLQLIGQILMNFENIQGLYFSDEKNLMTMMNLMVSSYKTIAKESYHIFKLFVVYDPKSPNIYKLLKNNAEKLIPFLPSLIDDSDGPEMKEELDVVIQMLENLSKE